MRSTFRVLFYVKKSSERPNGNLPLMCRITVDGEIKQFSCKMDVPPRLWGVWSQVRILLPRLMEISHLQLSKWLIYFLVEHIWNTNYK